MLVRNLPLLAIPLLLSFNLSLLRAQSSGDVVITEIMYNSPDVDEWIEIYNSTVSDISLDSEWQLQYGSSTYDFTGVNLPAGEYLTIGLGSDGDGTFNNSKSFTPDISTIGTPISTTNNSNNLDDGTTIKIVFDPLGVSTTIDELTFKTGSPWAEEAKGGGPTLELIHTSLDNSSGSNWQASTINGGSPANENTKRLTSNTSSPDITSDSDWDYGGGSFTAAPGANDNITVALGHSLEISSSASVNNLSLIGDVELSSGTFTISTLNISSSGELTNSSTLSLGNIIQDKGSEVTIDGTVNFDQGGTCNITNGDLRFSGEVTQSNSTDINVQSSRIVTFSNGASLVTTSGSFTGDSIYIERSGLTQPLAFNIWSSPVTSAGIISTFPSANACDMYIYDEINQVWSYDYASGFNATCNSVNVTFSSGNVITGGDGIMDVGRGYFVPGNAFPTRTFFGIPNTGNIDISMGTSGDAWNLIGNPYPCAVNLDLVSATNSSSFSGDYYFWIDDLGSGGGYSNADYATYNSSGATAANGTTPTSSLPSGQGFWVEASGATFSFTNAHKISGSNSTFYKSNNTVIKRSWFTLSNSDLTNQILIAFSDQTSEGYDKSYDAYKWEGNADIYFASNNSVDDFVIQALDEVILNSSKEVPLSVKVTQSDNYSISMDSVQNFSSIGDVYLEDTHLNYIHDLSDAPYNVFLDASISSLNRFKLHFYHSSVARPTSNNDEVVELSDITARYADGELLVFSKNAEDNFTAVKIFDIQGKLVDHTTASSGNVVRINNQLKKGIYLIKYSLENGTEGVLRTVNP